MRSRPWSRAASISRDSSRSESLTISTSSASATEPPCGATSARSGRHSRSPLIAWRRYARAESSARPLEQRAEQPFARRLAVRQQVREQLVALGDLRRAQLAVDLERALAEVAEADRRARVRGQAHALGDQRAAELVPDRVRARLAVDAAREHRGQVGERLHEDVVGPLPLGGVERDVGGAIGGVLVAGAPLGLGQIDRRGRQLEDPVALLHPPPPPSAAAPARARRGPGGAAPGRTACRTSRPPRRSGGRWGRSRRGRAPSRASAGSFSSRSASFASANEFRASGLSEPSACARRRPSAIAARASSRRPASTSSSGPMKIDSIRECGTDSDRIASS